jgi:hypothetical protein
MYAHTASTGAASWFNSTCKPKAAIAFVLSDNIISDNIINITMSDIISQMAILSTRRHICTRTALPLALPFGSAAPADQKQRSHG